jgi:hypothetical protein
VWQHALALLDEMKQASLQPAARLIYHDLSGTASEGRNSRSRHVPASSFFLGGMMHV